MSGLPKIARARLQAESAGAHPDPDLLTAFYEQALPESERQPVLAHLANCADCRLMVALAMPPTTETTRVHEAEAGSASASMWGWSGLMRWASVAACVVVVAAAVMIYRPTPTAVRPATEEEVPMASSPQARQVSPDANPASSANTAALSADKVESPKSPVAMTSGSPAARSLAPETHAKIGAASASPGKKRKQVEAQTEVMQAEAPVIHSTVGSRMANSGAAAQNAPAPTGGVVNGLPMATGAMGSAVPKPIAPSSPPSSVDTAMNAKVSAEAQNQSADVAMAELKPRETPGRAKAPSVGVTAAAAPSQNQQSANQAGALLAKQEPTAKAPDTTADALAKLAVPAKWTLSKEGQLQRSFDDGATWEPAPVVERAKFTALSVIGVDVWAGGEAGLLYHSVDNGRQWTQVKPTVNGVALSSDIKNVSFTDLQHGAVTTSDNQQWTTTDGGSSWQVKP